MKRNTYFFVAILVAVVVSLQFSDLPTSSAQSVTSPQDQKLDYPAPRYPKVTKITSVEELLPNAEAVIKREKGMLVRPGYGIRGGEKVLIVTNSDTDPLVVEAFTRALRAQRCSVDVVILQSQGPGLYGSGDAAEAMATRLKTTPDARRANWLVQAALKQNYDIIIGQSIFRDGIVDYRGARLEGSTRESLASAELAFPEELHQAIERKTWGILRRAYKVRITDPEGTDLRFTWFEDYWKVVEGMHPTIKIPGAISHVYGAGKSEDPIVPSHLMGVPYMILLPQSDGEGVVGATISHKGTFPHLKMTIKNHQIVKIEGGGSYGDRWRELLEKRKNIQYPFLPGPGSAYWMEAAIGTNPKSSRPHYVYVTGPWSSNDRRRSGVIHLGFGTAGPIDSWAAKEGVLGGHDHVHLYFPTYEVETRDGEKIKLIDKGHLTVLDDPEVREIAARYGDPDELLREDWVPAIPGINVPGDYWKDYANNPRAWIEKEHREVYGHMFE